MLHLPNFPPKANRQWSQGLRFHLHDCALYQHAIPSNCTFSVFLSIMEWAFDPIFKVDAPLIPKIKSKGDTSQFQDYEENEKLFRIGPHNVHAKDFEDFWGGPKYKQKVPYKCKQTTSHFIIIFFCWYGFLCFIFCLFKKIIICCIVC